MSKEFIIRPARAIRHQAKTALRHNDATLLGGSIHGEEDVGDILGPMARTTDMGR